MMKLMITVGAAVVGIAASAASIDWSCDNIYKSDDGGTKASNYLVYFLTSSDYAYANAVTDVGKADFAFLSNAKEGLDGAGVLSSSGWAENSEVTGYAESQTMTAYLVIFDASTVADAKNVYITSSEENITAVITTLGALEDSIEFYANGTATAQNWKAVPEPTSGILLLLGLSGLALKRKNA